MEQYAGGFLLFAKTKREELETANNGPFDTKEEFIKAASRRWKKLSAQSKRSWNKKTRAAYFEKERKMDHKLRYGDKEPIRWADHKERDAFECVKIIDFQYNAALDQGETLSLMDWVRSYKFFFLHIEPHFTSKRSCAPAELGVVSFSLEEGFIDEKSWLFHLRESADELPENLYQQAFEHLADHGICFEDVPENKEDVYVWSFDTMLEQLEEITEEDSRLFILGDRENYNTVQGCLQWIRDRLEGETEEESSVMNAERILGADMLLYHLKHRVAVRGGSSLESPSDQKQLISMRFTPSNIMENAAVAAKCFCKFHKENKPHAPEHCALATAKMSVFHFLRQLHELYGLPLDRRSHNPDPERFVLNWSPAQKMEKIRARQPDKKEGTEIALGSKITKKPTILTAKTVAQTKTNADSPAQKFDSDSESDSEVLRATRPPGLGRGKLLNAQYINDQKPGF